MKRLLIVALLLLVPVVFGTDSSQETEPVAEPTFTEVQQELLERIRAMEVELGLQKDPQQDQCEVYECPNQDGWIWWCVDFPTCVICFRQAC